MKPQRILFLLLIIALGVCAILFFQNRSLHRELGICRTPAPAPPAVGSATTAPIALPVADTATDSKGRQHVVFEDTYTRDIIRRQALDAAGPYLRIIDSLKETIRSKQGAGIEGYMAVQLQVARDSVRFMKRQRDSARRQMLAFDDSYVRLRVQVPAPEDTTSNGTFDLNYNADLQAVEYSTVRRVLGIPVSTRRYFTDISGSDPRMTIRGAEKFTIARRVPPLGFRVQALTTYNPERGIGYGVGTRFDAGERFNMGANWIYSPQRTGGDFSVYAKYDLLQWGR